MITEELSLPQFIQDPEDATFINNPHLFYTKLHKITGPIFWKDYDLWCLTEFDVVNNALCDSRFARRPSPGYPHPEYPAHLQAFAKMESNSLLILKPSEHTRIRKSINRAFANRCITQMQARIEALANQLIDKFIDYHETDLLSTYATTLPVTVIARLLGVPEQNALHFSHGQMLWYVFIP